MLFFIYLILLYKRLVCIKYSPRNYACTYVRPFLPKKWEGPMLLSPLFDPKRGLMWCELRENVDYLLCITFSNLAISSQLSKRKLVFLVRGRSQITLCIFYCFLTTHPPTHLWLFFCNDFTIKLP